MPTLILESPGKFNIYYEEEVAGDPLVRWAPAFLRFARVE